MKRKLQIFTSLQNLQVCIILPVLIFFMNPVCTSDDVTIAMCPHFRGLICPWARTGGFCRIVTKLVNLTVRVRNLNTPSFSVDSK